MGTYLVRTIIITSLLMCMAGCATLTAVATNPVAQMGVKYAVARYFVSQPDKASYAENLVAEIKAKVDRKEVVTVYDIETLAIDSIPWDSLSKPDQIIVMDLIAIAGDQLRSMVGNNIINEDQQIKVKQFFDWILQAIKLANQ